MVNRCVRCNRILINPPKMIGGQTYGPVCYRRVTTQVENGRERGKSAEVIPSLPFRTWGQYDEDPPEEDEASR